MLTMRVSYLVLMIALLAGCAGTPPSVDKESPPQGTVTKGLIEPGMSDAIAALNDGKPIVAEALLRGTIQRHPQAAMPWVNLGLIQFRRGEWGQAQRAAQKALELQPQTAAADYLLGLIAHQQDDAPRAYKHYQTALEKDQQHAATHYNLALLYDTYYQNIDQAVVHYRHYLGLISHEDKETLSWLNELEAQLESNEADTQEARRDES